MTRRFCTSHAAAAEERLNNCPRGPSRALSINGLYSLWNANWLSGYYHAKRNNSIIQTESFEDNVNKLTNYCYDEKNFGVPIMEAVERVLGK